MNDMEIADIIMTLDEPYKMKYYGRRVQNFSQTLWEQHCMEIVEKGNITKVLFQHKSAIWSIHDMNTKCTIWVKIYF